MKITTKGVKFSRSIGDMYIGEVGYTVPWAYDPITGELDFSYDIDNAPVGTASMKVTRTIHGFDIDIPKWYKYSKNVCPPKFT